MRVCGRKSAAVTFVFHLVRYCAAVPRGPLLQILCVCVRCVLLNNDGCPLFLVNASTKNNN